MIDTDKYKEHTPGPWYAEEEEVEGGKAWTVRGGYHWVVMESDGCLRIDWKKEDALLAADAPLLLAEVKRLRERLMLAESALGEVRACYESGQGDLGEILEHYRDKEGVEMPNAFDEVMLDGDAP